MMANQSIASGRVGLLTRIRRNYSCYLFAAPFTLIFLTFTFIPVIVAVFYSLTSYNLLEAPVLVGWANYQKLFVNDDLFIEALKNTLSIAVIVGPVGYLLSLIFAWLINDFAPKLRALLTMLFFLPGLASAYAIWKILLAADDYGIVNAYLTRWGLIGQPVWWLQDEKIMMGTLIFIMIWGSIGNGFLAFIAGFQTIDVSLYEAGAIDGVRNRFQEMWFITLPSMKPQLMFGAVMSIGGAFNVGDVITVLVGSPTPNYAAHTLVHHIEDYANIRFEMGYACSVSVVLFILVVGTNKVIQKMLSKVGT